MLMQLTNLPVLLLSLMSTAALCLLFYRRVPYTGTTGTTGTTKAQLAEQINQLLPQTQCGYCGYHGCKPYAEAITEGEKINRCPPGGDRTVKALARLMDTDIIALDIAPRAPSVAVIREEECIGCTKCIQACPVDAIVGAAKLMHTVISDACTGCDLCVEPCPVDCIDMVPLPVSSAEKPAPGIGNSITNSIIARSSDITYTPASSSKEQACIRCGFCADACPSSLQPQLLLQLARSDNSDALQQNGLNNCIECRACDAVCPSNIPLVAHFRAAKKAILLDEQEQQKADQARSRFESWQQRLQRIEAEKESRRLQRLQKAQAAALLAQQQAEQLAEQQKQQAAKAAMIDPVQAALERAKAKQQESAVAQTISEEAADSPVSLLEKRIATLEEKLPTANEAAAAVIRRTLHNMQQELAQLKQSATAGEP